MSSELSVGGKLAKPVDLAPNETALRRAGLYLDGLAHNGCNEVKTLRRLVVAAQLQGEAVAWATVFRKPGAVMKIEVGPENHEKNAVAGVWGWTATYQPLFLNSSPIPVAPAGWKLVPIQPTKEMLKAVDDEAEDKHLARGRAISAWGLMLDAAPAAPGTEQGVGDE